MKKDLDDILKKTTARYGLEYDENGSGHMVKDKDGNITPLREEDIQTIFGIPSQK